MPNVVWDPARKLWRLEDQSLTRPTYVDPRNGHHIYRNASDTNWYDPLTRGNVSDPPEADSKNPPAGHVEYIPRAAQAAPGQTTPPNTAQSGPQPQPQPQPAAGPQGPTPNAAPPGGGAPANPPTPPPPPPAAPRALDVRAAAVIGTPVQIQLEGRGQPGQTLTYEIVAQPLEGTAALNGSTVTYTPGANVVNTRFTYKVNNGTADSNVATVYIAVTAAARVVPPASAAAVPWYKQGTNGQRAGVGVVALILLVLFIWGVSSLWPTSEKKVAGVDLTPRVEALEKTVGTHTNELTELKDARKAHADKLNEHTAKLNEHSDTLKDHADQLAALKGVPAKVDDMNTKLDELLKKPASPATPTPPAPAAPPVVQNAPAPAPAVTPAPAPKPVANRPAGGGNGRRVAHGGNQGAGETPAPYTAFTGSVQTNLPPAPNFRTNGLYGYWGKF